MDVARLPTSVTVVSAPGPRKEAGFSASVDEQARLEPAEREARRDSGHAALPQDLRERLQAVQRDLSFSVDESTGDIVVRVIDGTSGTLVRQIPSEELLRLAERLEDMRSLLFEAKA